VKQLDWAYLAGFFDGEGCISLHSRYRVDGWRVRLTVSQSDYRLLALYEKFEVGRLRRIEPRGKFKARPSYQWIINKGSEVEWLLQGMMPYLRFKKDQASLAILLCDRSLSIEEQWLIGKKIKKVKSDLAGQD
jgi:hypothetical protein